MKPVHSTPPKLTEASLAFALLKAAAVMTRVLREGRSLDEALAAETKGVKTPQALGAIQDLAYFGMRNLGRGQVLSRLISGKALLNPEPLNELMALGFGLLWEDKNPKYPAHTVVDQMVYACTGSEQFARAKGLANACLRNFLRDSNTWRSKALEDPLAQHNLPAWWVEKLKTSHPQQWQTMLAQSQSHPPLVVRVNTRSSSANAYADQLNAAGMEARVIGEQAVLLAKPVPVSALPGFDLGQVSVQDSAAQLASQLLNPQNGQRILDACAAPGGKTGHLLELADIELVALDSSPQRLGRVEDNIRRIAPTLNGQWDLRLKVAQAELLDTWWDGVPFDGILADVPCTGSGVVRRHPDIPWLRRPDDIAKLSQIQHKILNALWSTLKPGGTLLLVTCSIFPEEGPLLAKAFLDNHSDALAQTAPGWVLPVAPANPDQGFDASPDGFFYAKFEKSLTA
ncbi:16S rRNA (cytosine(967)-C(5))-methyltransferase RsmB [Limnobacter alexandrii]|uniref:16S rRNA (cytosine(967)-C(5))-methyltransferase RsmB n=1 Tax=Limnobacter alexandrii TaxID=2570352 RepID=UPI0011094A53|nr:16S rRNA (cytosine(967)-C(5))-methyltransferase RsmB [Limnobacter alexandrii]